MKQFFPIFLIWIVGGVALSSINADAQSAHLSIRSASANASDLGYNTSLNLSGVTTSISDKESLFAPTPAAINPIVRTKFQKAVGISTDVAMIALPLATLTGVIITQDWEGLKQGVLTAVVAGGANYLLKYSVRELRPDHSNYHSFPSMHSTVGFATAGFVQRRYGWKFGIPAYIIATYTAAGRVVAKKHHWWDCIAGAGIGAASAYIFTTPWARSHELSIAPVSSDSHFGLTASLKF